MIQSAAMLVSQVGNGEDNCYSTTQTRYANGSFATSTRSDRVDDDGLFVACHRLFTPAPRTVMGSTIWTPNSFSIYPKTFWD